MSIVAAVIALGFLIFFHELGHFLAAKACGVGVLEFSVGMGPRLLSKVIGRTRYSLKLLPFGGSTAMLGEDAAGSGDFETAKGVELSDDSDENVDAFGNVLDSGDPLDPWIDYDGVRFRKSEISSYSFQEKPAWKRFIICIAGVANNFLLAFLLSLVLCAVTGFDVPIIVSTEQNAPAAKADIPSGSELKTLSFDGGHLRKIESFRELYIYLYLYRGSFTDDTNLHLTYKADGVMKSADFHPMKDDSGYRLGLSIYNGRILPANILELTEDALHEVGYNISVVFDSFRLIFAGRVTRQDVMGPVGAVTVMGETVQESSQYGLVNALMVLIELTVMLSANLAVMNLLPVPALDGGRLLFILLEMISRRRLNPKVEDSINTVGMLFLLALMVLVMLNDFTNIFTGAYTKILNGA